MKSIFKKGEISPKFIAQSIENHQSKIQIGAHQTFMVKLGRTFHKAERLSG